MTVKSFGCSFVFGSDLSDNVQSINQSSPSELTWCAHLARSLGHDYKCYARPGSGNLQILENILNQLDSSDQNDVFVIGWTWIDRFDYYFSDFSTNTPLLPWSTLTPSQTDHTAQIYYRDLHSEYQDKLTNLSYIKLAIDTLQQNKISFIMTYMDELMFDQQWHVSPAIKHLQEYIQPWMTKFDGKTFLDWSRSQGYAESAGWHPLEQAHLAGFGLIKNFVDPALSAN